ncbi:hypothetical protein AB835_10240 [Candidatus Endobugula sertula]|uniref:Uncharacterized protein n=1 Tax=Candidatus Endobugula sertula TaxID=62101 RepID=A0A1D2QNI6_9GAMM|nr:hypothetical protein AB835_10240 [Candidatus Endobugula sertula]
MFVDKTRLFCGKTGFRDNNTERLKEIQSIDHEQCVLSYHFLQHWFELSDPSAEEILYDSRAMCQFVGIDVGKVRRRDPDMESTRKVISGTLA